MSRMYETRSRSLSPQSRVRTSGSSSASRSSSSSRSGATTFSGRTVSRARRSRSISQALVMPDRALAKIVGDYPQPRTEIISKIWDHVRSRRLQDPDDRRIIRTDAVLEDLSGEEEIHMLDLGGIVADHVEPLE